MLNHIYFLLNYDIAASLFNIHANNSTFIMCSAYNKISFMQMMNTYRYTHVKNKCDQTTCMKNLV